MKSDDPPRIVFLEYMSRSGSTLLANLMDKHASVYCTLELDLPHYLFETTTRPNQFQVFSKVELSRHLDHIWKDPKLAAWPIPPSDLHRELTDLDREWFNVTDIVQGLATCLLRTSPSSRVIIFKGLLKNPELFPFICLNLRKSKLLGVIRDPRAVFSSQLFAKRYNSSLPLGLNRAAFIRDWKRFSCYFGSPSGVENIHLCRFEDLIANEKTVIAGILQWLSLPRDEPSNCSAYHERIPPAQLHLHENVGNALREGPLTAWQEKLPAPAWKAIQEQLGDSMANFGYVKLPHPPVSRSDDIIYGAKESWTTLLYRLQRLKNLLIFPTC